MKWSPAAPGRVLLAGLLGGVAGCTWIIGDIPVPDEVVVDAEDIAGAWYVYGLADGRALDSRIEITANGQIDRDGESRQALVDAEGLWQLDLGEGIGAVRGRFDARGGVGLMVQHQPSDAAAFVVLIREPAVRGTLLGGRSVQLELTEAGSPLAEFARLQRSQDEVYRQTERLTLTEGGLEPRMVTVVSESEDAPRWIVRFDTDDWLLSPLVSGDGAIGVLRSENGSPRGPVLVWRDPVSPSLPDRALFCTGLTVEDGQIKSRMRSATIRNDRIEWSDGRRGAPATVDGAAVFEDDGSFYDDQGTLVLPDAQGRLFALLPLVPRPAADAPQRSWGMALCIGLDAEEPADLGVDAGPVDMGAHDATPDAAIHPDAAPDARPDSAPHDAAVEADASWDMAPAADAAP